MHVLLNRSTVRRAPLAAALLLLAPLGTGQDTPAAGFGLETDSYPGQSQTATLSNGDILHFDGTTIARSDAGGSLLSTLATLPAFAFGSFLVVSPDETFAVLGESSLGNLYSVDLAAGGATVLTNLFFNYDADWEAPDSLIVSAATCGFGCGNELFRVDTTTGLTTLIANVGGASGPVVVEANGDVVYGRPSDTFSLGDHSVLRFAAADLTGSPVAQEVDAAVVGEGFDGAGDLARDPVDGRIYLAENDFVSGINRIRLVLGDAGLSPVIVEGATGLTIGNLEFEAGDGEALFRAYQPSRGGLLRYNSTDFFAVFERQHVVPARPALNLTGPGTTGAGDVTALVSGGPVGGFAALLYGPTALFDPLESPFLLPALEAPLFTGLDLGTLIFDASVIALDGAGAGQLVFPHDGSLIGLVTGQALVVDDDLRVVQMSTPASL